MYIYIEKADSRIIRLRVKEDEIKEAKRYADKLKGHPDIKFVLFDEKPDLVNCDFSDEGSRKVFLPG